MFDGLSDRLASTAQKLRGEGRLTEKNIQDALRDVRMALLEADVALSVVRSFIEDVKQRALGEEVLTSLKPGHVFVSIVQDELVKLMGAHNERLDLSAQPPAVVLMAGLQGAGKTTTVAKLAKMLSERETKKSLLVSCDIYRPAAIEQLKTLAAQVGAEFFPSSTDQKPTDIATAAIDYARKHFIDVVLVDTAGRLHIDEQMMAEIKAIHAAVKPVETLFVVDSMTGQDAANTARVFNEALPLTGIILTKTDGDARGGAALSIRQITGKPIKFMGSGEKIEALEAFYPDRVASRILGMGDVLSLVEEVQQKVDHKKAEKLAKKIQKGKSFDFNDLKEQFEQMQNMGGMAGLIDKLPGMPGMADKLKGKVNDREVSRMIGIINSMTPKERSFPDIIKGSRKRRIAEGSGLQVQDVNRLLKQQMQMRKMMKKMSGGGMAKMMRAMKGRGMPPGMGGPGGGMGI
ncbi:MAG: signal recognition particle protein [Gammaproteobacteria bacterium]|nr:signal recognition particle protein [Gammaproteobacteria bacterium]